MQLSTKKIVVVAYLQIFRVVFYVKTASEAMRYKQCSNALFVKALQTLQTLHIFESQARVRIEYNINTTPYEIPPKFYHLNLP